MLASRLRYNISQAFRTIRDNRMRSMMSIIGMAIGIVAVIVVTVVSQSGKSYVFKEFESYGLETLWMFRDYSQDNPDIIARSGSGISNEIYARIKKQCCQHVQRFGARVYPQDWKRTVKYRNQSVRASVEGVDVENLIIDRDALLAGRSFRDEDIRKRRPVALVTPGIADALNEFTSAEQLLGRSIDVDGLSVQVIGVLRHKDRSLLESLGLTVSGYDINRRVLIPYTLYQQKLGIADIQEIIGQASTFSDSGIAIREMQHFMQRAQGGRYHFKGETMQQWVDTANRIIRMITLIGGISALAALLVGGVGVYNLMRFSVSERTNEIGLRRAVGGSIDDIRQQFLAEAWLLGALGGGLGLLVSLIAAVGLSVWAGVSLGMSWLVFVLAPAISMIIALLAGYGPAMRAARMSPMEALRFEGK